MYTGILELPRNTRMGNFPLCREQSECKEHCLGMDDE